MKHCESNPECKSFIWFPIDGNRNVPGKEICKITDLITPTIKTKAVNGEFLAVMCVPQTFPEIVEHCSDTVKYFDY